MVDLVFAESRVEGQGERLNRLNQIAIRQMQVLTSANLKTLPGTKGK